MSEPIKPLLNKLDPPERSRTYHFPNGDKFLLSDVVAVGVGQSGSHRLETADGKKYIVNKNWLAIELDVDFWTY